MKLLAASFLTLLLFLSFSDRSWAQSETEEIKSKERELEKLRREIDDFEEKIKKSEQREKSALETLDYYDRQSLLLHRLLWKLKEESSRLQKEIEGTRRDIVQSENQLQSIKNHYAKYVASVYKYGRLHDLELILTAKSVNQLAIRIEYLRRFTDQRRRDLTSIGRNKSRLEDQSNSLQAKLDRQERLIALKANEETRIKKKTAERQALLASLKKNKDNYKKELQRKSKAATELESIIADLIEKERIRREHEAAVAKSENRPPPESITPGLAFASRRGKLPWPV